MYQALLVFIGSGMGGTARFALGRAVAAWAKSPFPFGTVLINITGSFLISVVAGLSLRTTWISPDARLFLITGVIGGYTTYSSFNLETLVLAQNGQYLYGVFNLLGTIVLCTGSGVAGFAFARAIS